jgi:ketosteroid isomerase-like protein
MSNVAVVESMYESFASGDMETVVSTWNEDIELHEPEGIAVGGIHRGQDEVVELLTTIAGMHEEMSATPERYVNSGDTVVALGIGSGTAAETGKSMEFPFAHVFDFEGGKISRWTSYIDTALFNAAHEE